MALIMPRDMAELRAHIPGGGLRSHDVIFLVDSLTPEADSFSRASAWHWGSRRPSPIRAITVSVPQDWSTLRNAATHFRSPGGLARNFTRFFSAPTLREVVSAVRESNPEIPIVSINVRVRPAGSRPSIRFIAGKLTRGLRSRGVANAPPGVTIPYGVVVAEVSMPKPPVSGMPDAQSRKLALNNAVKALFERHYLGRLSDVVSVVAGSRLKRRG